MQAIKKFNSTQLAKHETSRSNYKLNKVKLNDAFN